MAIILVSLYITSTFIHLYSLNQTRLGVLLDLHGRMYIGDTYPSMVDIHKHTHNYTQERGTVSPGIGMKGLVTISPS